MRIGLIVDGKSELIALPALQSTLATTTGRTFLSPSRINVPATAEIPTIALDVATAVTRLSIRQPDLVILLLDREQRLECSGDLARKLRAEVLRRGTWSFRFDVIIKDRMFENWLIAALGSLRRHPGRFSVGKGTAAAVAPNKADHVDALALLARSVVGGKAYEKVADGRLILATADPLEIAANSRSFRRFLRCIGHPSYQTQSRHP